MTLQDQKILLLNNQGLHEAGGGVTILDALARRFAAQNRVTLISEGRAETSEILGPIEQRTIAVETYYSAPFWWRFHPTLKSRALGKRLQSIVAAYDCVIALDCHYAAPLWRFCADACKVYISLSAIPRLEWREREGFQMKLFAFLQYVLLERRAFQRANISIVASRKHLQEIKKSEWIRVSPKIIYPIFAPDPDSTHQIENLPTDLLHRCRGKQVILTVTRLTPLKNIEYLLELAEQLREEEVLFVVVGDGEHRPRLAAQIRQRQLDKVVWLHGPHPSPEEFYRMADVYIHPSYYESFSCAIYEAMSWGLPVIFPANVPPYVSGFEELISNDEALCLDFTQQSQVLSTLRRLLHDTAWRENLSTAARRFARALADSQPPYAREVERLILETMAHADCSKVS